MENLAQCEACLLHRQPGVETSYTDFLAMHPPTFVEAIDLPEVDNCLRIIKSKFGLLHCTEIQNTLFVAQQLHEPASAWWTNFTTTIQDGHQVPWAEFHMAFCGHHILVGMMAHKVQEFLHLQQGLAVCTSTTRSSTTSLSMAHTTPILMRRRCHFSVRGSALCCVST
jgi:hypothetical protein